MDVGYPKLKIYVSKLILENHIYIPVVHVTMHWIIWP